MLCLRSFKIWLTRAFFWLHTQGKAAEDDDDESDSYEDSSESDEAAATDEARALASDNELEREAAKHAVSTRKRKKRAAKASAAQNDSSVAQDGTKPKSALKSDASASASKGSGSDFSPIEVPDSPSEQLEKLMQTFPGVIDRADDLGKFGK